MNGARFEKVVLVTRKTRLAELIERFNSRGQARFYINSAGGQFADYEDEDERYRQALEATRRALSGGDLKLHVIDRALVPTYLFSAREVVVALGQDGLVANVAKYTREQPLIGVNPDPSRNDGVLLPYRPPDVPAALTAVVSGRAATRRVTLAQVVLSDGQELLAFNDLFIGVRTHASARYRLRLGQASESQLSSGVIVSTGAGSTGWLSSVYQMASRIAQDAGLAPVKAPRLSWEERRLRFVVREPFPGRAFQTSLVSGQVNEGSELVIESLMPSGGVIFSDGVETDFLNFNSGVTARIRTAAQVACLVAPRRV